MRNRRAEVRYSALRLKRQFRSLTGLDGELVGTNPTNIDLGSSFKSMSSLLSPLLTYASWSSFCFNFIILNLVISISRLLGREQEYNEETNFIHEITHSLQRNYIFMSPNKLIRILTYYGHSALSNHWIAMRNHFDVSKNYIKLIPCSFNIILLPIPLISDLISQDSNMYASTKCKLYGTENGYKHTVPSAPETFPWKIIWLDYCCNH